jgi:hypothetical protein
MIILGTDAVPMDGRDSGGAFVILMPPGAEVTPLDTDQTTELRTALDNALRDTR